MSEDTLMKDTLVAGEDVQPANTDAEVSPVGDTKSDEVETPSGPNVENKDGKMFVDGVRVYSRDDTNRIAAKAREEAEKNILADLDVDSFDKVKNVVQQLQSVKTEEGETLNVNTLRDAVKKREQTVEELKSDIHAVKTDYALREHISTLKESMPTSWNPEQKSAVVDLMKARDMFQLEGDNFAIKNGGDYFTTDGETPDYKTAVEVVGKNLGLPFAKQGVKTFDADKGADVLKTDNKGVDESRLSSDPAYRNAYVTMRQRNGSLTRSQDKFLK